MTASGRESTHPRLVAAVDLSSQSAAVCEAAAGQARSLGAEVVLVHVVHELASLFGVYVGQDPVADLQADLERRGGELLQRLVDEHLRPTGIAVRRRLLVGTPWAEILDVVEEEGATLLVMGTHAAAKPEHRVTGGTVQRVLQHSPVPVLLVPPAQRG